MDFRNAPKKRTTNFREDETKLLIQLWGSPIVQNKLYLTHRKAPVMRLISANMQKHGFYRTPDEIKTRIRNLKCLYHRIKKSMATGTGIGTIDPDWPHYKAMDEILSKKNALRQSLVYNHNLLSEVSAGVKEEDIEINDDGESSNSNGSDDEFEETPSSIMPATITPLIIEEEEKPAQVPIKIAPKLQTTPGSTRPTTAFPRIQIAQNLMNAPQLTIGPKSTNQIQVNQTVKISSAPSTRLQQASNFTTGSNASKPNNGALPFPLFILNGMPNGVQSGQNGSSGLVQKTVPVVNSNGNSGNSNIFNTEVSHILREMLMIQRENLEIERERLEVERQKLEFERTVGSQLLNMVPAFNEIFESFNKEPAEPPEPEDTKNFSEHPDFNNSDASTNSNKRSAEGPLSELKSNKMFKESVINGIKKYMQETTHLNHTSDENSDVITNVKT